MSAIEQSGQIAEKTYRRTLRVRSKTKGCISSFTLLSSAISVTLKRPPWSGRQYARVALERGQRLSTHHIMTPAPIRNNALGNAAE